MTRHSPTMIRAAVAAALLLATSAQAAVIGQMTPAPPLTRERLADIPAGERAAWSSYLDRSEAARRLNAAETTNGPPPTSGDAAASMPLSKPARWYATPEARHIADVIVSFQSPAGGWGKNAPRTAVRQPGQPFSAEKDYVGTLDNDATVTELRFLARVITAGGEAPYRDSFVRGVRWLLAAQYPNGGWPQVWPLVGGYHDAVTFNDDAMVAALSLLGDIAKGQGDYAFAAPALRADAEAAWRRGLAALLKSQVVRDGRPTGWPQQADAVTLAPVGARNFEPAALASAESAGILAYLITAFPTPPPEVAHAIGGGVTWLRGAAIADKAWRAPAPGEARRLVDQPGAAPLWARYYDLATGRPIFGDRDRTIHDDVHDLSAERRNGYAWFTTAPAKVLKAYGR
ncbi:pectate lyase [Phenylobacterium sp.]|uniref:pectate lyase n=1 Tax=Phenylobacterium sp. TaxID=1871053 RepID=UPI003BAB5AB3